MIENSKIIAIVGPSGSGKDTAARMLADMTGYELLVSYTTRPMREGEQNGREHIFVSSCETPQDQMLAYTQYGGYEYWTELSQIHDTAIYVIDESGLLELHNRFPDINIFSIHITASKLVRLKRGVTFERISRDDLRGQLPLSYYDHRISNNKSLDALKHKIKDLSEIICSTQ